MRISDWSSDVCSSDLRAFLDRRGDFLHFFITGRGAEHLAGGNESIEHGQKAARYRDQNRIHACLFLPHREGRTQGQQSNVRLVDAGSLSPLMRPPQIWTAGLWEERKIGRASCRERGCKYVYISVGAVYLKKKHTRNMRHNKKC